MRDSSQAPPQSKAKCRRRWLARCDKLHASSYIWPWKPHPHPLPSQTHASKQALGVRQANPRLAAAVPAAPCLLLGPACFVELVYCPREAPYATSPYWRRLSWAWLVRCPVHTTDELARPISETSTSFIVLDVIMP
ncbi:hypothetical protein GQ53DRAFT_244747 [Thozetella sp. PMI_491]|nr:hypothetical protein GQ53DRAFT_244747 [Thozetella sp. PMI_491]